MPEDARDTPILSIDPRAHALVLEALERTPRGVHVSALTIARAVCGLARERFGLAAGLVLRQWGLLTTGDIGRVVFRMVEEGIVRASPGDSLDDFSDVFDMSEALERDYPWGS